MLQYRSVFFISARATMLENYFLCKRDFVERVELNDSLEIFNLENDVLMHLNSK